jgi:hypothetical protein
MPNPRYSISRLADGKYKLVRYADSRSSRPLSFDRMELEHYLKNGTIIGSTAQQVLATLDHTGRAEVTMTE